MEAGQNMVRAVHAVPPSKPPACDVHGETDTAANAVPAACVVPCTSLCHATHFGCQPR